MQVIVTDGSNHRVQVFRLSDGALLHKWGCEGRGYGQFNYPFGLAVRGDAVLVADYHNHRVQMFRLADGAFVRMWGSAGAGANQFDFPAGVAVTKRGQVLVSDWYIQRVQVFE